MTMSKTEFLKKYPTFAPGLTVYSADHEKLGTVVALDEDGFTLEKGWFFPKDFSARYWDVQQVREDEVVLAITASELDPWRDGLYSGWDEVEQRNTLDEASVAQGNETAGNEDVRVPIAEEELEATKVRQKTGEVRLKKGVHTELKTLNVPVKKEEVVVERTPVTQGQAVDPGEASFQEQDITVPIMEEEVEVHKRPVVKEELRVSKKTHTEDRRVSDDVRKEDVKVDRGLGKAS